MAHVVPLATTAQAAAMPFGLSSAIQLEPQVGAATHAAPAHSNSVEAGLKRDATTVEPSSGGKAKVPRVEDSDLGAVDASTPAAVIGAPRISLLLSGVSRKSGASSAGMSDAPVPEQRASQSLLRAKRRPAMLATAAAPRVVVRLVRRLVAQRARQPERGWVRSGGAADVDDTPTAGPFETGHCVVMQVGQWAHYGLRRLHFGRFHGRKARSLGAGTVFRGCCDLCADRRIQQHLEPYWYASYDTVWTRVSSSPRLCGHGSMLHVC